jgi:hypothetical protein
MESPGDNGFLAGDVFRLTGNLPKKAEEEMR